MFTPDQVEEAMEMFEKGVLCARDALTIVREAQLTQIAQGATPEERSVLIFYRQILEAATVDNQSNVINKAQNEQ